MITNIIITITFSFIINILGNIYNWVIQGDITKCFDNISIK